MTMVKTCGGGLRCGSIGEGVALRALEGVIEIILVTVRGL